MLLDIVRRRGTDVDGPGEGVPQTNGASASSSDDAGCIDDQHEETSRFLLLLRLNTLIDASGLIYRIAVPTPIWIKYYSQGPLIVQQESVPLSSLN